MNVLVVGANGQIGRIIVELLHGSEEHTVRAMVRKQEQAENLAAKGIETVLADLEGSVKEIEDALKGTDAVIFSAGSGGSTGPDKTLLIDLDGALKTIEAAQHAGTERFVIVSSIAADRRENWTEDMKPYLAAKHAADLVLKHSGLTYTILRPGGLKNESGTGMIKIGQGLSFDSIPRQDVANVVIASLNNEKTYCKEFDLITGDTPIEDALASL